MQPVPGCPFWMYTVQLYTVSPGDAPSRNPSAGSDTSTSTALHLTTPLIRLSPWTINPFSSNSSASLPIALSSNVYPSEVGTTVTLRNRHQSNVVRRLHRRFAPLRPTTLQNDHLAPLQLPPGARVIPSEPTLIRRVRKLDPPLMTLPSPLLTHKRLIALRPWTPRGDGNGE